MNAHRACLVTAQWLTRRSATGGGHAITAWSGHKAISLKSPPAYHDDLDSVHSLAHKISNNVYAETRFSKRRVMELDQVSKSCELLDQILSDGSLKVTRMVEAAYIASIRRREKRFGEAITIGWTVCEQLISKIWNDFMATIQSANSERMPKDRRDRLNGRDYSASVVIEILELSGLLGPELFRMLEVARKARNKWAHQMREPRENEVRICLQAIELLMQKLLALPLHLGGGGRGGVPQWPVWFWPDFKP